MTEKIIKKIYIVWIVILAAVAEMAFYQISKFNPASLTRGCMIIAVDILCILICLVLLIGIGLNKPLDSQNRAFFRLIFILGMLSYSEFFIVYQETKPEVAWHYLKVAYTINYMLNIIIQYCYWTYIREELNLRNKRYQIFDIICKVAAIVFVIAILLNWRTGIFFHLTKVDSIYIIVNGKYMELLGGVSFISILALNIVILMDRSIRLYKKLTYATFQIFPALMIINVFLARQFSTHDIYKSMLIGRYIHNYINNDVNAAYLLSILVIYINIFSQRSKKLLEKEIQLEEQSTALMISQIQPHFLYNVLTTISNLCVKDPEEAEETTILFAQYLRTNLDSLRNTEPIPFGREMEHIKTYIELEKKRFGSKLNVEYDIKAVDFQVPALGLQPIVENSVKHGIRGKDSPGHLKISSRKKEKEFEVVIEDDGVGFDTNAPMPEDGKSHVGMHNVRYRLQQICGASMTVESSPGNGCKTIISFPFRT